MKTLCMWCALKKQHATVYKWKICKMQKIKSLLERAILLNAHRLDNYDFNYYTYN